MTLALYGGSFNPPHLGHTSIARHALETLRPDTFLWMPAGRPPHKDFSPGSPGPGERWTLSRLALENLPGITLCDLEMRGETRYTADTARALCKIYRPQTFWLIMGTDMFLSLEGWREPDALLRLCDVAVYGRTDGQREALDRQAAFLRENFFARVAIMEHNVLDISSTELRAMLARGEGAEYLSPAVFAHIAKEGLYGFPPNASRP